MNTSILSNQIKAKAFEIGFSKIGIAKADYYNQDKERLDYWIDNNFHGSMNWIKNRKEERSNIYKYYPNAKSIISVAINYFTGYSADYFSKHKISNYAWGDDYHITIKTKLIELLDYIKNLNEKINGICCVDTSPISEKVWAQRAGIGWIGKHTNLITREFGSWIFLGEIILDTDLIYDKPFNDDLCGTCTACIEACPTDAIISDYQIDSNKCISYLTIEHRDNISSEFLNKMDDWIYGCDICQEVCPWSQKFSVLSNNESFKPREFLIKNDSNYLYNLSNDEYLNLFKNSAMKRSKHKGLKRNIDFIS
tara:strand:- start:533 stop:1459 length:927 start_codon:yes stop_codon:yes gene_type:complete